MTIRSWRLPALACCAAALGCSPRVVEPDASLFGWPECPDGGVPAGGDCVDPSTITPCDLIERLGGCPDGYHCVDGSGCVPGVPCAGGECERGMLCVDDRCTCGAAPCPDGQYCALVVVGGDGDGDCDGDAGPTGPVGYRCVGPEYDGDCDGYGIGDNDGDEAPDDCDDLDPTVGPGSTEVCDGVDNDCDGAIDEGFDDAIDHDGDGFTGCGYTLRGSEVYGPDCDPYDPAVHPGAIDHCHLGPDGTLENPDCDETRDSCPLGSQCCEGVEGCVYLNYDPDHCGSCESACDEGEYCVVRRCDPGTWPCADPDATTAVGCASSAGTFEPSEEGIITLDDEAGTSNHPDVAWNWLRVSHWFPWRNHSDDPWSWYQYFFWELDYGIAWVRQTVPGHSVLLFTGRHFLSTPMDIDHAVGDVTSYLAPYAARDWYDTTLVAFLEGEDTIPALAPAGGLGYGLAWSDDGAGGAQIRFAGLGAYGSLSGWSQQITFGGGEHLYPRLAWSPYYYFMGSGYGLVYQVDEETDSQVFFQQIQGYWDWWHPFSATYQVSDNAGGALSPDIAWSPYGFGVVYVGAEDSNLYFALVGAMGGLVVPPQQVTADNNVAPWRPSIAWNSIDGEFGVAYQATSPPADNQDIYFVRTSIHGAALGAPLRLTSDPDFQRHPDMAWTGDGYGVTWYDHRSGTDEIAFVYIDPMGIILDGPTMITRHGASGNATNPALTHVSVSDEIDGLTYGLAGWSDDELVGTGEFGLVWRDQATDTSDPQVRFLRLAPSE